MKLNIFICAIFLVGCAQQPKEAPNNLKFSKYNVENVKRLKVIQHPKPSIPVEAINNMQSGWCIAKFDISKDGIPKNVNILECSPKNIFESFCQRSIEGFKFDSEGQEVIGYTQNCVYRVK
jgi:hypothetical protein